MLKGNIPLKSNNFFKPILNPSKTKHKRTREEQSVDDSIRVDNNSNNNNNNRLGVNKNVDAEESLFKSFKRCKITRSSGELRLKKRCTRCYIKFDKWSRRNFTNTKRSIT